jgi:hypothetical protein
LGNITVSICPKWLSVYSDNGRKRSSEAAGICKSAGTNFTPEGDFISSWEVLYAVSDTVMI